jgi:hypothetical protein
MKLAYKHNVTVIAIPAGVKVGDITSRDGALLVTASTDPDIKAPSIIQVGSSLLDKFNIQQEYAYPWYYGGLGGLTVTNQAANQLGSLSSAQNYGGVVQLPQEQTGNKQTVEEIQYEVDKLVDNSRSGAV